MATSSHLNWLIIRNNNAFLLKKRDVKKPFSTVSEDSSQYSLLIWFNDVSNLNTFTMIFEYNMIVTLIWQYWTQQWSWISNLANTYQVSFLNRNPTIWPASALTVTAVLCTRRPLVLCPLPIRMASPPCWRRANMASVPLRTQSVLTSRLVPVVPWRNWRTCWLAPSTARIWHR